MAKKDVEEDLEKIKNDIGSEDELKQSVPEDDAQEKPGPKKPGFLGKIKDKIASGKAKENKVSKKELKKGEDLEQSIVREKTTGEGGPVSYDENIITPDEFESIEEDESVGEEEEVKETAPKEKDGKSQASVVDQIMMKIERMEGRISAMDGVDKSIQERISSLSEEIGELRSSILEKERTLNEIETQAKRVTDAFEEIEPENFRKELEKKEEEIAKNQAEIESLVTKQKEMKNTIKKLEGIMERVKSFENLVEMSEKINEKFSQIEENKKYTSRIASKVENIFSELNNRLKDFRSSMDKIEMNDETIKELMKTVDMTEIKLEKLVEKEKLNQMEKEIKEQIENNKMDLEDKVYDLKDFLEDMVSKSGGVNFLKSKKEIPWRKELQGKMDEIEKLVKNSKSDVTKINGFRKELAILKNKVDRLEKTPRETKVIEKPAPVKPKNSVTSVPEKEIPVNIENWLKENINKGYNREELRESLKRGGYDSSYVDTFFARSHLR